MIDRLGFGGAAITSVGNLNKIMQLLNYAYDNGITHFDTAPLYGQGYSEIIYGKFLKDKRYQITIATKFGFGNTNKSKEILLKPLLFANKWKKKVIYNKNSTFTIPVYQGLKNRRIEKKELELSFIKSITSLKIDYIDNFLLHEGIPSFLTDEALKYLIDLRINGDILKLGIAANINTLINIQDTELKDWDILQYEGFDSDMKQTLKARFPDKEHIHHSCLMNTGVAHHKIHHNEYSNLLAKAVLNNLNGKVIFSSRNINRVKENVNAVSKLIKK